MAEINPYQSPQEPESPMMATMAEPASGGVWRQGKLLVMHKRAALPDRCVKSNLPADGRRLKRSLYWHSPWVYVTILAGVLVYAVLALILRKRAVIQIGLSEKWARKRRRSIAIAWGLVLGSVAMFVIGAGIDNDDFCALLILLSIITFFGGAIYGLLAARVVTPVRIDDEYVWLKGVHPDFLAALPELPGGR